MNLSAMHWLMRILIIIHINAAVCQPQAGQKRTAYAHWAETPVVVDGQLNELAWSAAKPISSFIQQSPNEGHPASEQTVVRILFNGQKLYIGFECFDSQPSQIVANEMKRDGMLWQNDNVYLLIDPYGGKRSGFFFRTNALGAQADSAVAMSTAVGTAFGSQLDIDTTKAGRSKSPSLSTNFGSAKPIPWSGASILVATSCGPTNHRSGCWCRATKAGPVLTDLFMRDG